MFRDVMGAVIAHVGGEDVVSETQRLAIRRVATLETEMIHMEDAFAHARIEGEVPNPQDLTLYAAMANAQRRFCEALGWHRTPREIVQSIEQFTADIEARKTAGVSSSAVGANGVRDVANRTSEPVGHVGDDPLGSRP